MRAPRHRPYHHACKGQTISIETRQITPSQTRKEPHAYGEEKLLLGKIKSNPIGSGPDFFGELIHVWNAMEFGCPVVGANIANMPKCQNKCQCRTSDAVWECLLNQTDPGRVCKILSPGSLNHNVQTKCLSTEHELRAVQKTLCSCKSQKWKRSLKDDLPPLPAPTKVLEVGVVL